MAALRFGSFEIDGDSRCLLQHGKPVTLGARAFDVLLALVQRRDRVVSKHELLDLAWPGLVVEENNLQVQISSLRKLLGPAAIATVPGRGYRFTARLEGDGAEPVGAQGAAAAHSAFGGAGQLPPRLSALIGRDDEQRVLTALIQQHPLVTIVGAGGMGKTALALAVAQRLRGAFRDGVCWVDLAPLSDDAWLVATIAHALRASGAGSSEQRLVDALAHQSLLLVLDNGEHLVSAVGPLARSLAASGPDVRVLVTSQKRLGVGDETLFGLGPLGVPAAEDDASRFERCGAVQLFVERACVVQPDFALGAANRDAVAQICRRLDGTPLAIELAAARVHLLGVRGVLDHLDERFRLLTGGSQSAPLRHQTLAATLEWSHSLLAPTEQTVLRRLGSFAGGFSLALAQVVAGAEQIAPWDLLDSLSTLVDSSLVQVDAGEPPRYRLLESTRAYAQQRLTEHGEAAVIARHHAHAVRDLCIRTEQDCFGDGTLTTRGFMQALAPELDNLRVAFAWAHGAGDLATATEIAATSATLFRWLGLTQEGLDRLVALRPHVDTTLAPERLALYWWAISALGDAGRLPIAERLDAETHALDTFRARGDRRRLHQALYRVAWSLGDLGRVDEAWTLVEQMQSLERAGDTRLAATRLNLVATLHLLAERFDAAVAVHAEQRELLLHAPGEEIGLAICQNNLCSALNALHRHDEVVEIARSTIEVAGLFGVGDSGFAQFQLLYAQLSLGALDDAMQTTRIAMPLWLRDSRVLVGADYLALQLAVGGRLADAARVDAASAAFARRGGPARGSPVRRMARERTAALLDAARLDATQLARWRAQGEQLDAAAIAVLCLQPAEAAPAQAGT